MSLVAAVVTATHPPYNPEPHAGSTETLQVGDSNSAVWRQGWQAPPIRLKYVFDGPVTLRGYVVAPPPEDLFSGPNGWRVDLYRHGRSRDAWNRVHEDVRVADERVRGWPGAGPQTYLFGQPVDGVGEAVVTFGSARSLTDIGVCQMYFIA